jgi:hypothetical protein
MADELRTCRRTGCNDQAAASLSFRYETRQVWMTGPVADGTGTRYELCAYHADTLTVPNGWHVVEERDAARRSGRTRTRPAARPQARPPMTEPEPRPPAAEYEPAPPAAKPARPAHRKGEARPSEEPRPGRARRSAAAAAPHTPPPADAPTPDRYARLLRELPRLAADALPVPSRGQDGETTSELTGQLAIPVPERGPTDAVVVSLTELAGARRDRERLPR